MANYGFDSTTYDNDDRLTAWNRVDDNKDQSWSLSAAGDWNSFTEEGVTQTRTHDDVHEITLLDATSVSHDAKGNLTKDAAQTYAKYIWDFDNRMSEVDTDDDDTSEVFYTYDALGRRVSKEVDSTTTVYAYDGQQVAAEYAANAAASSPDKKFVYATYIDEPVLMVNVDGETETKYYYHQNSLYSVAALTNQSGTVVERYSYLAYGNITFHDADGSVAGTQSSTVGNPYLFTGRRLDNETGLQYSRARYYDFDLGRFIGRDPIGYLAGSTSLYQYVKGHPLGASDPSGLQKTKPPTTLPPLDDPVPKPENGQDTKDVKNCEDLYNNTIKNDAAILDIWQRFLQLTAGDTSLQAEACRNVGFFCSCCKNAGQVAGYISGGGNGVQICANHPGVRANNMGLIRQAIAHELIHASQHYPCNTNFKPREEFSCALVIAGELQAYRCAGSCGGKNDKHDLDKCLDMALVSAKSNAACMNKTGEEIAALRERVKQYVEGKGDNYFQKDSAFCPFTYYPPLQ